MGLLCLYPSWHKFTNFVTVEVKLLLSLLIFYAVLIVNSSAVDDLQVVAHWFPKMSSSICAVLSFVFDI
jgi:hypothetical protein